MAFCRDHHLPTSGGKQELTERIACFLDSGMVKQPAAKHTVKHKAVTSEITPESVIEEGFLCTEAHRAFFKKVIGNNFSFNVQFQQWLKSNAGKTYADAVTAYRRILDEKKSGKSPIAKQFEYNTYIRDFFEDNAGKREKQVVNDKYICKDQDGNLLISIDDTDEEELSKDPLFTHCLAIVKVGNDYLLNRNKWRNRYEIFGGSVEKGESAHECIIRECFEELGVVSSDFIYLGAMKFLLKPDYFSKVERIELGGLYGITLPDSTNLDDLYKRITDKDEIKSLAWYSQIKGREPIALIDEKLLAYF